MGLIKGTKAIGHEGNKVFTVLRTENPLALWGEG